MRLLSWARWTGPTESGSRRPISRGDADAAGVTTPPRDDGGPPIPKSLLFRAITMSIDASDNMLDPVMPRFALSLSDAANLVAYLELLGSLPEPGVNERSIVVGIGLRPGDSAIRSVLVAYVDEINRRGDLFGRRLILQVMEPNAGETFGSAVARLAAADTLFGLLAPVIAGDEVAAVAAMDDRRSADRRPRNVTRARGPSQPLCLLSDRRHGSRGPRALQFRRKHAWIAGNRCRWQHSLAGGSTSRGDRADRRRTAAQPMRPDDARVSRALAGGGTVLWFADGGLARSAVAELAGKPPRCCCPAPWRVICLTAARRANLRRLHERPRRPYTRSRNRIAHPRRA